MAVFKSYTHLERINKIEEMLDNTVILQPKLDGTCSEVYSRNGEIYCGSRSRELKEEKDNANFRNYILNSDDGEIVALRDFIQEHENYIVYGEWIGGIKDFCNKFVGSFKNYKEGGFFIFDVFDIERGDYLDYDEWAPVLSRFYHRIVPVIAILQNPSVDDVAGYIDQCVFNVVDEKPGEGIVIKAQPTARDKFGNVMIGKLVRDEFKQSKSRPKKQYNPSETIAEFVETFVTESFMDKCRNKVLIACGDDEFDTSNKKHVGMFISLVVNDVIDEEMFGFLRKKKFNVVIDFAQLRANIQNAARDFLGL